MPAWRVAWFNPKIGRWSLSLYEYLDQEAAQAVADFLPGWVGGKARLVPCDALISDHGVNA